MSPEIHWRQGLFLQPHHLQRLQKGLRDLLRAERRQVCSYPYGVIEAVISPDELKNSWVRVERLRAILGTGVEVNFPGNAVLAPLQIRSQLEKLKEEKPKKLVIHLGVPLWSEGQPNATVPMQATNPDARSIYTIEELKYADENTGRDERPVEIRKLNARLLVDGVDDLRGFETLPLLRVMLGTGQASASGDGEARGFPTEDPEFAPPCLRLHGSHVLRNMVGNLVNLVQANRSDLAERLGRSGFNYDNLRGVHLEQFLRLRILNRFSASLPSLIEAPAVTPFEIYLALRELLGELAALYPERDPFACEDYNHESPYRCFAELAEKISPLLPGTLPPSFKRVRFAQVGDALAAALPKGLIPPPDDYYLGITLQVDHKVHPEFVRFVQHPDRFKLMPRSLMRKAWHGVALEFERAPRALPAVSNLHYFRLDRGPTDSKKMWDAIEREGEVVIPVLSREFGWNDDSFSLYMTIPQSSTPP